MICIVGFDLSLTCTGWCDGAGVGTLVPPKGYDRGPARLDWIRAQAMEKAEGAQLVVIEGYAFAAEATHAHSLGELGGVVKWNLFVRQIPTGKGNAKKQEMFAAAIRQLGYVGSSFDEADALWLWTMAQAHYAFDANLTEVQRKAMSKVEWPTLTLEQQRG